jgi:isocitrate dehydrogenase kinase/phosphatase
MDLYEKSLSVISDRVEKSLPSVNKTRSWMLIKEQYQEIIFDYCNKNIAETFFNSLSRKIFMTKGLNRDLEFFYLQPKADKEFCGSVIFKTYKSEKTTKDLVTKIINDTRFATGFNDFEKDIVYLTNELDLLLWPYIRDSKDYSIQVIKSCFFRNKVAYIIGRICVNSGYIPMLIPLYNDESGIYIDSVLFDAADINNIFGFYYSYFHVNVKLPNQLVNFLKTILPLKPRSELFNSIGFIRHGKTEFYCDLHRYVHLSKEKFEFAPGQEGAVMIVFTLPNYNYVFKVIKDKPCFVRSGALTDKTITKLQVKDKYNFVRNSDRVGRLVDTQEFEYIRFKIKRFSEELLHEFNLIAKDSISVSGDYVIIQHLYIQRKVTPLPIYFYNETDINSIRSIVIDFGYFIKDLVATGLFPADLFNSWNYGVTENNRIVLYDYDDIVPLQEVKFKEKPKPRIEYEEIMPEEDWIIADKNDFFLDEIEKFLGIPEPLEGIFRSVHGNLYSLDFWRKTTEKVLSGEVIDIIPYDRTKRFKYHSREA